MSRGRRRHGPTPEQAARQRRVIGRVALALAAPALLWTYAIWSEARPGGTVRTPHPVFQKLDLPMDQQPHHLERLRRDYMKQQRVHPSLPPERRNI